MAENEAHGKVDRKQRRSNFWRKKILERKESQGVPASPAKAKAASSEPSVETAELKAHHGKRKKNGLKLVDEKKSEETEIQAEVDDQTKVKKRFVLFVGNLPFDTTKESVLEHFSKYASVTDFRMLTKKDGGFKGCGFLELPNAQSLNKCLRFHRTSFLGRRINVELCGKREESSKQKTKPVRGKKKGKKDKAIKAAAPEKPLS